MGARCHLPAQNVTYPSADSTSATVAAWLETWPIWCGYPVRKFDSVRRPTACCDRPVSSAARVGEHSGVTWKLVNCTPPAASRSTLAVSMSEP